jgi:hypothetical protein
MVELQRFVGKAPGQPSFIILVGGSWRASGGVCTYITYNRPTLD